MTDDGSQRSRPIHVTIDKPRLTALLAFESLGILVCSWAILEVYILGGNPMSPQALIPIGTTLMAVGSTFFAKVYDGPGLMSLGSVSRGDRE